ncbi:hypothetical protein [Saccharibacillus sp. JS10]|uniref:hypothetical protein n=1 Tax=Saccharibacillus sp. JS10 TaxID=2950552 RepID=UPI002108C024|nr:hypothetical protein [Saccharibacillus sp. JS10]MCQ4088429.1 hypothetical protein [Saccharibacillus sp. JS10]
MESVLSFQKIWEDEHLIELSIRAISKNISCNIDVYVDSTMINDLIEGLSCFVNHQQTFEWIVSDKSDQTSNYFFLRPYFYNKSMHIALEIEMIEKTSGVDQYKANFYLRTEMSYIDELIRKLTYLTSE